MKAIIPLSLISASILNVAPAVAQNRPVLEEITVTAQRREQNLQDVPVSVTAFSEVDLRRGNIRSAIDFLAQTPNTSFTEDGSSGSRGLGISVRGVNNLVTDENSFVNSVGIYLDEFSIASVPNGVANPMIPDLERLEVLRGPQGTFFGRNSLGGALNITTRKPTDEFGGEIIVGAETYDDAGDMYNVTGILNVPVTDSFSLRGVLQYEDSDGYVENACASGASASACPFAAENDFTPNGADDSGHEYTMARLNTRWNLSERTTIDTTLIYTDEQQDTDENVPSGVLDLDSIDTFGITQATDPGTGFWPDNRNELSHDRRERNDLEGFVAVLNLAHQLNDSTVIRWVSGYLDSDKERHFDNDLIGGADIIGRQQDWSANSWSTEVRMEMTRDDHEFVAGVMYAEDNHDQDTRVFTGTNPTASADGKGFFPPFPIGLDLAKNLKEFEVESVAVFADYTWHATEKLDLIAGARYTNDTVTNKLTGFGFAPTLPGCTGFFPCLENFRKVPIDNDEDFDDVSARFVALYQLNDDVNVYGSIAKGYKAGGTSLGYLEETPIVEPFDEESLWNYEIGFKSELFDHRLRLNGSVFFLQWEDLQLESFRFLIPGDLNSNFEKTINVDEAEATGAELELLVAVTDNLTVRSAIGYLDTEITRSETAEITGSFVVELENRDLPKSPELTASIVGRYDMQIGDGEGWIQLEYIHRDGQFSDVEGLTYQQTDGPSPSKGLARNSIATYGDFPFRSPDYDLVHLRAGYELNQWSFAAYVQNLTDEEYYTGTQENFGISGIRLRPHPQTIGGNISYRF